MMELIKERFVDHMKLVQRVNNNKKIMAEVEEAGGLVKMTLVSGSKILLCGNGGSAADAQHWAAEFVGRFQKERNAMPAIALTTDTSILTAIANDYGYDKIFSRQVQALGRKGDLLIALSTSGNSANVVNAVEEAQKMGIRTIGMTAEGGGKLKELCDVCIVIPSKVTARAQEVHELIGHILCEIAEY